MRKVEMLSTKLTPSTNNQLFIVELQGEHLGSLIQ